MTGTSKSAKSTSKAKKATKPAAKPAKAAVHKKIGAVRKVVRKAATTAKHTVKATRATPGKNDEQYLKYSGKFTVRLPKSLHRDLVERAEKEGVSLNLFVTNALSSRVASPSKKK